MSLEQNQVLVNESTNIDSKVSSKINEKELKQFNEDKELTVEANNKIIIEELKQSCISESIEKSPYTNKNLEFF